MEQRWNNAPLLDAERLQNRAREYLAEDAGTKYMSLTVELDRLLEVVAGIAGDVKKDADSRLRVVTMLVVTVSLTLGLLVLAVR
jgi:hypothetical protein